MDPKKLDGHVEKEIQPKYAVLGVFVLSENTIWAHLGRDPKRGPNWNPMVPKGPPWAQKGPPWAQSAHLEAEGRLKGSLSPIGPMGPLGPGGTLLGAWGPIWTLFLGPNQKSQKLHISVGFNFLPVHLIFWGP